MKSVAKPETPGFSKLLELPKVSNLESDLERFREVQSVLECFRVFWRCLEMFRDVQERFKEV